MPGLTWETMKKGSLYIHVKHGIYVDTIDLQHFHQLYTTCNNPMKTDSDLIVC